MSPKLNYSPDQLRKALDAIDKGMNVLKASKMYKIPKSTLHDKIKGKSPRECKMGRQTYLKSIEESLLVE